MNIILFEEEELSRPLPPGDPRGLHLRKVLHARRGDGFAAGIVGGGIGEIVIQGIQGDEVFFRYTPRGEAPPLLPLELIVGAPRPLVTRRLLKDLTSLGARALHFVTAELGEKSYLQSRVWEQEERRRSLLEGAQQAGTTLLPQVRLHHGLEACLAELPRDWDRFVLDPQRGELSAGRCRPRAGSAVLAVGPERGWTDRELDLFSAAGFVFLRMGERILRTESAALVGASIILSRMGFL